MLELLQLGKTIDSTLHSQHLMRLKGTIAIKHRIPSRKVQTMCIFNDSVKQRSLDAFIAYPRSGVVRVIFLLFVEVFSSTITDYVTRFEDKY